MFATGRWPNIAGLGLETAGIAIAPNGGIAVDAYSRTSVPSVHAIGDVTNRVNLTPVAIREGQAFADTVFGSRPTRVDHVNVPSAVFSEPEIGAVGLTEHAALQRLPRVDIYKSVFRPLKATLSGRATRVLMKLVVDGATDRVVGCHIVGERRRRNDPARRHRGKARRHQGRFRRHRGRASHRRRRDRDHAHARQPATASKRRSKDGSASRAKEANAPPATILPREAFAERIGFWVFQLVAGDDRSSIQIDAELRQRRSRPVHPPAGGDHPWGCHPP